MDLKLNEIDLSGYKSIVAEHGFANTFLHYGSKQTQKASKHSQIIVATQSPRLIDAFAAEKIVVVERNNKDKSSVFKKWDEESFVRRALVDQLGNYQVSVDVRCVLTSKDMHRKDIQ